MSKSQNFPFVGRKFNCANIILFHKMCGSNQTHDVFFPLTFLIFILFPFAILLPLKYTVWHLDSAIIADNSAPLSYAQVSFSFQPEQII